MDDFPTCNLHVALFDKDDNEIENGIYTLADAIEHVAEFMRIHGTDPAGAALPNETWAPMPGTIRFAPTTFAPR